MLELTQCWHMIKPQSNAAQDCAVFVLTSSYSPLDLKYISFFERLGKNDLSAIARCRMPLRVIYIYKIKAPFIAIWFVYLSIK